MPGPTRRRARRAGCADRDRAGRPADLPRARPGRSAAPPLRRAVQGGARSRFDVPPGQLELKMVVEGQPRPGDRHARPRDHRAGFHARCTMSFGTPRVYRVRTIPELQALRPTRTRCRRPSATSAAPIACHSRRRICARRHHATGHRAAAQSRRAVRWRICRCSRSPGRPAEIELRCRRSRPANT